MRISNHYDVIVIGADLAGLVAAALVAARGKRVLVIPHGPVDGLYRAGPRSLALDASPVVHAACQPVLRVYEELGMLTQIRREIRTLTTLQHWALDDHRVDLPPQPEGASGELLAQFGDPAIAEAFAGRAALADATAQVIDMVLGSDSALVPDGFWARRFLQRASEQLPPDRHDELAALAVDHPARLLAAAYEPWLLHLAMHQLGAGARLRLAALWAQGPLDRSGGLATLRQQLIGRIELKSGEIKSGLRVAEIVVRRGRAVGVALLGKKDRYGADHVVVATDPTRLLDGPLESESLSKPLSVTLSTIHTVAQRFLMHLEVGDGGLSPALEGIVLAPPRGVDMATLRERHGIGTTYVRVGDRRDDGARMLSVTRIIAPDEDLTDLRERVLTELDERGILPFVRPHLRFVHSPHDGRPPTDGEGRPVKEPGPSSDLRALMDPIVSSDTPPNLGAAVLPNTSDIRNLAFAGRFSLPGLGVEGEFAAGYVAAGAIAGAGRRRLSRTLFVPR